MALKFFRRIFSSNSFQIRPLLSSFVVQILDTSLDLEKTVLVPMKISGPNGLFEIKGGTPPYRIESLYIDNTSLSKPEVDNSEEPFNQNIVKQLTFRTNFRNILDLFQSRKQICDLHLSIKDSQYKETEINLRVNLFIVYELLKNFESLKAERGEAIFEESILNSKEPKITIQFHPPIKLRILEPKPELKIDFGRKSGITSTELRFLAKEEKQAICEYPISEQKFLIEDLEKFLKQKDVFNASLEQSSTLNNFKQIISIDISEVKRGFKRDKLSKKSFNDYTESDLVAVHVMKTSEFNKVLQHKVFGPSVMFASPFRPSNHFTLNHVVGGHMMAPEGWTDTDLAIIIPFKDFMKKNKKTFYGGTTVDIFTIGYTLLPKSFVMLNRNDGEPWEDFIHRIEDKLTDLGFPIMEAGSWNWSDDHSVQSWLKKFASAHGWQTTSAHSNTDFYKAEKIFDQEGLQKLGLAKGSRKMRVRYIKALENLNPTLFNQYKKQLISWKKYWDKKL